jgi:hypothetical protein
MWYEGSNLLLPHEIIIKFLLPMKYEALLPVHNHDSHPTPSPQASGRGGGGVILQVDMRRGRDGTVT